MLLLQEVEDWHLELCEREPPGLADKVTEAIEALVAADAWITSRDGRSTTSGTQTDARHPLPDPVRLRAKRQACFWWPATRPGTGGPGTTRRSRSPSHREPMDQETGVANERADGPTVVAVKRDAVASVPWPRNASRRTRSAPSLRSAHSPRGDPQEQSTTQSELARSCTSARAGSRGLSPADWLIPNSERSIVTSRRSGFLRIVADFVTAS